VQFGVGVSARFCPENVWMYNLGADMYNLVQSLTQSYRIWLMTREKSIKIVQTILINAAPRTIVPDQRCGRYWIWELIDRWVDKRAQIVDCALIIAVDKQY